MNEQKIMKDMGLNDPVAITMPAHAWIAFMAAYGATDWVCDSASAICVKAQEAVLDPVYLNERLAAVQARQDAGNWSLQALMGRDPDFPPNMGGPE